MLEPACSGNGAAAIGKRSMPMNCHPGKDNVEVPVLIDVRKLSNDSQHVVNSWSSAVRLYTLNEFVSRFGNIWE